MLCGIHCQMDVAGGNWQGQKIQSGEVHLLCQMNINSSRQINHDNRNILAMWSFHIPIWLTCHILSKKGGAFVSMEMRWRMIRSQKEAPLGHELFFEALGAWFLFLLCQIHNIIQKSLIFHLEHGALFRQRPKKPMGSPTLRGWDPKFIT